jgi:hypothetical protein
VPELIEMDKNYLDRINLRKRIMAEAAETALAANPAVKPAVDEFYHWLLWKYLPTRFPRSFQLRIVSQPGAPCLFNLANGDQSPLMPPSSP